MIPSPCNPHDGALKFYVAPAGNDRWSGMLDTPNSAGTDGPFATITRAQDAVRILRGTQVETPICVYLRAGVYYLDDTLTFTPEDSGAPAAPVCYAAYPGEAPSISGGREISGWQVEEVQGNTCWTVEIPDVATGAWYFTQLFINGMRRRRTRLPKAGFYRFTALPDVPGDMRWGEGPDTAHFAPGEIQQWTNLPDVELIALQNWFETHHRLQSVDEAQHAVTFRAKSLGSLTDELGRIARYYVENVFEALDTPGEWYLDRPTGKLYYLPLPGEEIETVTAIAPRLEYLVRFTGSDDGETVQHIQLENLQFRHAEWTLPPTDPGPIQAAFYVPGAICLHGAERCVLFGCTVAQVSQYAIEVMSGSVQNAIVGCSLHDLGAGGVKLTHETGTQITLGETVAHDAERCEITSRMGTFVSDCTIHDGGIIHPSAIGVFIGDCGRNRVRHNHIYNFYYSGISCGWTWGYVPTRTIDNRLEYNYIHDIGRGLLSDMGGIYMLGHQPGAVIRGNIIHDVQKYGYGGWGIYTDEGSADILIEDNITYRTHTPGFFQHYGRDNLVRNNIFALGKEHQIGRGREEDHRSFVVEGNIIYWREGNLLEGSWKNGNYLFRKNLYWQESGKPFPCSGVSWADWQAGGQDSSSIIANPLFTDPDAGAFTLREDSPAIALGFHPIDTSLAGPRFRGMQPVSVDELWLGVPPATIVSSLLEITAPFTETEGGNIGKVRLTVRNLGDVAANGSIIVIVTPSSAGHIRGENRLNFNLQPGKEVATLFTVETDPDIERLAIETEPLGDAQIPTYLLVKLKE